jgi:type I restriction enzyme, S subunit
MNADRLLAHYERIADAPEAIPRLRRFILDLAVRGKLVPQDPNDEPTAELLKRIAKEKAWLVKAGEIRNERPLPAIEETLPDLPNGWQWVRLGETGRIFNGDSVSDSEKQELQKVTDGRPFIATKDVGYGRDQIAYDNGLRVPFADTSYKTARAQSVLICSEGGSAGKKIGITDRVICFGNKLYANETWSGIEPRYIFYVYQSASFYRSFADRMTGIIGGIARSEFLQLPVSLPPLAEQHRIVAKVNELMALCDRLEAARAGREKVRDRLAAASLARLNAPNPATFQDDTRFALDTLQALATRPDQIKPLRQTILNLAVRGKLVPQDPNDEPASELLKRIAGENKKLLAAKGIRSQKPALPAESFEAETEIPASWRPVYLQDLAYHITDGTHVTPNYTANGKPFLSAQNVKPFKFMPEKHRFVSEVDFRNYRANRRPEHGDILMTRVGAGIGEAAVLDSDFEFAFYVSVCLIKIPNRLLSADYVVLWLNSPEGRGSSTIRTYGKGASQGNLNLSLIRTFKIPLPPLAEQHRIVAKVDALMALCGQLEASLDAAAATRRLLLDALLAEALTPINQRDAA